MSCHARCRTLCQLHPQLTKVTALGGMSPHTHCSVSLTAGAESWTSSTTPQAQTSLQSLCSGTASALSPWQSCCPTSPAAQVWCGECHQIDLDDAHHFSAAHCFPNRGANITGWPHTTQSSHHNCRGPEAKPHQRDPRRCPMPGLKQHGSCTHTPPLCYLHHFQAGHPFRLDDTVSILS